MINSGSIWKNLVLDAKDRGCFYNVSEDKHLSQAATVALVEFRQFDSLFSADSFIFNDAKWKVISMFGSNFVSLIVLEHL